MYKAKVAVCSETRTKHKKQGEQNVGFKGLIQTSLYVTRFIIHKDKYLLGLGRRDRLQMKHDGKYGYYK